MPEETSGGLTAESGWRRPQEDRRTERQIDRGWWQGAETLKGSQAILRAGRESAPAPIARTSCVCVWGGSCRGEVRQSPREEEARRGWSGKEEGEVWGGWGGGGPVGPS